MNWFLLFLSAIVLLVTQANGAKILAFTPMPIYSHHVFFKPIFKELTKRGHDVTVVTTLFDNTAQYKQIVIENKSIRENKENLDFFGLGKKSWISIFYAVADLSYMVGQSTFENPEVQNLIHSQNEHFDLVFVESTFVQESYVSFGHKFKAPVIELQSMCTNFWFNELTRNPNSFSFIVDYKTRSSNKMNFYERLQNAILGFHSLYAFRYIFLPMQQDLVHKYMNYTGSETMPNLVDLLADTSLTLVNTHVALHYPQPNNPNVINVAGLHIPPLDILNNGTKDFLDSATEGAIYFSLGSNVKSSMLPESLVQIIIKAFSKLPYKILWKFEDDKLANQPENVKIVKWEKKQLDVLCHPNVKGFIMQGGILSITESVYCGVPVITLPIFGDQPKNAIYAESSGFGITLKYDNITEESITWAIREIIKPKYQEAVKRLSDIFRDNLTSPMDTAIYWIEYVIRYKGAPHIRTGAVKLTWYQYYLLDVMGFILVIFMLVLITIVWTTKKLFNCLRNKTISDVKKNS